MNNKSKKKAMIFAAGMGTRLKPLTDVMPKALVPIAGKPMLEHIINKLKRAGFTHIVVNVHHFADMIIDFLNSNNNFDINISISDERNRLLDTGGGIKHASEFLQGNEPFLVHNVDIFSNVDLTEMYNQHCSQKSFATLLVSKRKTSRYLLFNAENSLCGWENKSTGELKLCDTNFLRNQCAEYAFGGIHVISPTIFNHFNDWADKFSIIDFYLSQAQTQDIHAYIPQQLRLIDAGTQEALAEVESS
jgi:NDP-sugar pyrophosphorylase family protein